MTEIDELADKVVSRLIERDPDLVELLQKVVHGWLSGGISSTTSGDHFDIIGRIKQLDADSDWIRAEVMRLKSEVGSVYDYNSSYTPPPCIQSRLKSLEERLEHIELNYNLLLNTINYGRDSRN